MIKRRKMMMMKRRWQTRDYPGVEVRKCEKTFGRDVSRGRFKCNDVTLLFFFPYVTCTVCYH